MNITAERYNHTMMLQLKGELTADTLDVFRKTVEHQLAEKDVIDLALNLEHVPFVDSACLEYFLELQDRLVEKLGQVKLVHPDENVRKILEITRLSSTFETYADTQEAIKALHA